MSVSLVVTTTTTATTTETNDGRTTSSIATTTCNRIAKNAWEYSGTLGDIVYCIMCMGEKSYNSKSTFIMPTFISYLFSWLRWFLCVDGSIPIYIHVLCICCYWETFTYTIYVVLCWMLLLLLLLLLLCISLSLFVFGDIIPSFRSLSLDVSFSVRRLYSPRLNCTAHRVSGSHTVCTIVCFRTH